MEKHFSGVLNPNLVTGFLLYSRNRSNLKGKLLNILQSYLSAVFLNSLIFVRIRRFRFRSGNFENPSDRFSNTSVLAHFVQQNAVDSSVTLQKVLQKKKTSTEDSLSVVGERKNSVFYWSFEPGSFVKFCTSLFVPLPKNFRFQDLYT